MVEPRKHMILDLGNRLAEDLNNVLKRHAQLAEGGGATTVEWSLATVIGAKAVSIAAIGGVVLEVQPSKRADMFLSTSARLHREIDSMRDEILMAAAIADKVAGI